MTRRKHFGFLGIRERRTEFRQVTPMNGLLGPGTQFRRVSLGPPPTSPTGLVNISTFKTMSSSTPAYLNDLIQIPDSCYSSSSAVIRRPAAERPKNRVSVFFSRGSAHLELTTIRHQILPYCGHLQTTPQDKSVQTVLT